MTILRALIWQRHDVLGAEFFSLSHADGRIQLQGAVVVALNGLPTLVQYTIRCDDAWHTRNVVVREQLGTEERMLHLTVVNQQWSDGERVLSALDGCTDVDLGITPATNTLPIRRLNLSVGQRVEIRAAWVRFPELTVEPSPQRYTRVSDNVCRYQSDSYEADLTVDELGLVQTYADVWRRVA